MEKNATICRSLLTLYAHTNAELVQKSEKCLYVSYWCTHLGDLNFFNTSHRNELPKKIFGMTVSH